MRLANRPTNLLSGFAPLSAFALIRGERGTNATLTHAKAENRAKPDKTFLAATATQQHRTDNDQPTHPTCSTTRAALCIAGSSRSCTSTTRIAV